MFTLEGKVTLVTGAASGIGAAIARAFGKAGAHVYVTDVDAKAGEKAAAEFRESGTKSEFVELNVASEEGCARAAQHVHGKSGRLDVLVNNAGIGHVGTMLQTSAKDLERLHSVNVGGVFNV